MLTARSLAAGTSRFTASLITVAPGGIEHVGRPPNNSALSDAGTTLDSVSRSAICAAPMPSGMPPKTFESSMRTRRPPMLVCVIIRSVWLWKLVIATGRGGAGGAGGAGVVTAEVGGAGGRGAGNARGWSGDVAHVLTQCSVDCAK